ncbi:PepSY-associated TM helix domain-containing protein [Pseudomonas corrugata]
MAQRQSQCHGRALPQRGATGATGAGHPPAGHRQERRTRHGAELHCFPRTLFSSAHHYGVFMKGSTHLTAHLLTPVLIDASTLDVTAVAERPWYMDLMSLSLPLHFGDYGGRPMQIFWAALDVLTIIVLGSGVYLWVVRRRTNLRVAADREAVS